MGSGSKGLLSNGTDSFVENQFPRKASWGKAFGEQKPFIDVKIRLPLRIEFDSGIEPVAKHLMTPYLLEGGSKW